MKVLIIPEAIVNKVFIVDSHKIVQRDCLLIQKDQKVLRNHIKNNLHYQ